MSSVGKSSVNMEHANDADNSGQKEEAETQGDEQQRVVAYDDDNGVTIQMSIWVWAAVLKFLTRVEMADRVSLVCHALKKLCWPRLHGNKVEPRIVMELYFEQTEDGQGRPSASLDISREENDFYIVKERIPIATGAPPPDYIRGFENIFIGYWDAEVRQFIRNIGLRNNFYVRLHSFRHCQQFLDALNGPIPLLYFYSLRYSIAAVRQQFPDWLESTPAIIVALNRTEDCIELREVILAKLAIGGGNPFAMHIRYWRGEHEHHSIMPIDAIKEAFQAATQPHSFLIAFSFRHGVAPPEPFRLENQVTGEVLALEHAQYSINELYRCPRGEVQQWREEANKLLSPPSYTSCITLG